MSAWVGARWIASSGRLGLLGLCLLMVSSQGCGGGGPESASIGTSEATNGRTIRPVPAPPLETMEAAVRTQLETRRREVEGLSVGKSFAPGDTDPALGRAYGELGRVYHAYNLFDAAAVAYDNARQLDPAEPRWPYLLAAVEEARGHLAAAGSSLDQVLGLRPDLVPALIARGRVHLDMGEVEAARRTLGRALELDPANAVALFELGRADAEAGDAELAAKRFERVLALQPATSLVHYSLAQVYRRLGRVADARSELEKRGNERVEGSDPWLAEVDALASGSAAYRARGGFAWREGRLEDAVTEYRRAVAADPQSLAARRDLAFVLAQAGRVDEALELLRSALEERPDNALLHHTIGLLEARRGRPDDALPELQKAVDLDPRFEEARWDLARVLADLGQPAEAAEQLAQVLALDPNRQEARRLRAVVLARAGRLEEAEAEMVLAVAATPDDVELRSELARLADHLGHQQLAREQRRALAALDR